MTALNRVYNTDHEHQRKAVIAMNVKRRGSSKGYIKENGRHQHRVVAERMLGRSLRPDEVVHHVDGVPGNNDPSNLRVMTRADHSRHHTKERRGHA